MYFPHFTKSPHILLLLFDAKKIIAVLTTSLPVEISLQNWPLLTYILLGVFSPDNCIRESWVFGPNFSDFPGFSPFFFSHMCEWGLPGRVVFLYCISPLRMYVGDWHVHTKNLGGNRGYSITFCVWICVICRRQAQVLLVGNWFFFCTKMWKKKGRGVNYFSTTNSARLFWLSTLPKVVVCSPTQLGWPKKQASFPLNAHERERGGLPKRRRGGRQRNENELKIFFLFSRHFQNWFLYFSDENRDVPIDVLLF